MAEINMDQVEEYIIDWLSAPFQKEFAEALVRNYRRFSEAGLADSNFANEFTLGEIPKRQQRIWEIELACYLMDAGYTLKSEDIGPDLCTEWDGKTVWFEAVSPEPEGIPEDYLKPKGKDGEVYVMGIPATEILLRMSWAVYQKSMKFNQYIDSGIVAPDDACVIAVDTSQLGGMSVGISGYPLAVEALFPAGPMKIVFDRQTGEKVSSGLSFRNEIVNKEAQLNVPTDIFSEGRAPQVSAVFTARADFPGLSHTVLVHNPYAVSSLHEGQWGVEVEYRAEIGEDQIELKAI